MSKALAAIGIVILLAGCAVHKPKPPHAATRPPAAPAASAADVHETSLPQSRRYRDASDGGPNASEVDVSKLVEPTPKAEPRARYGNKSPYSVLGKTYKVMADAHRYVERGVASWYGNKFHGYMTSSLEPYDMYQFSAAHKTLPLPSYARVTNLENGKSVVVRINDRGPFHEDRLIDLSYAAAVRIGVWPKGTGKVEVRVLDGPEAEPPAQVAVSSHSASPSGHSRIFIQLGAFSDRNNAQRILERIEKAGVGRADIITTRINAREIHRVRIGPVSTVEDANALAMRIEKLGMGTPRVAMDD